MFSGFHAPKIINIDYFLTKLLKNNKVENFFFGGGHSVHTCCSIVVLYERMIEATE